MDFGLGNLFCHAEHDEICILYTQQQHSRYFRLKEKRSRCPRAYYSNSCATYRVLITAGDIELNPGPVSLLEYTYRDIQVLVTSRQKVYKRLSLKQGMGNRGIRESGNEIMKIYSLLTPVKHMIFQRQVQK